MYSIISSANSESFTSFLIWIPFISFSSLIAVARIHVLAIINSAAMNIGVHVVSFNSGFLCVHTQQ